MSASGTPRTILALRGEFARFLAVGAVNTIFSYGLYAACVAVMPYGTAYSLSYAAGILASYFLNCRFVFHRPPTWRGAVRFPLVYVVQYALGLALLALLVERFHADRRLAAAVVVCCSTPLTFILSRFI